MTGRKIEEVRNKIQSENRHILRSKIRIKNKTTKLSDHVSSLFQNHGQTGWPIG